MQMQQVARIVETGTDQEREVIAARLERVARLTPSTAPKLLDVARIVRAGRPWERAGLAHCLRLAAQRNSGRAGGPSTVKETTT